MFPSHDMYNFEWNEEDEDEDEIIEKRRQQRLAILQKYKHRECSDSPAISAVSSPTESELSARDAQVAFRENVAEKLPPKIEHSTKTEHGAKVEEKVEESDMFADDYKVITSVFAKDISPVFRTYLEIIHASSFT